MIHLSGLWRAAQGWSVGDSKQVGGISSPGGATQQMPKTIHCSHELRVTQGSP